MDGVDAQGAAASAGGARAAGGLSFQAEVFAWWAARAVAGVAPGLGLDPSVRVEAVGCETGFPVDDVGVALSDGGFILVQAKAGVRRLDARSTDLRNAVDQMVTAMTTEFRVEAGVRSVDVSRDRLVIATDLSGSQAFDVLGAVCARLRDHPASLPLDDAAKTKEERKAFATFRSVVEKSWTTVAGVAPMDDQLRNLFRVMEVQRLDFAVEAGVHRVRGDNLLEGAHATQSFETLVGLGLEVARKRSWRQRDALATAVGVPLGASRDVPSDRDRLGELTRRTLVRLGEHRTLSTPDGDVRVERQLTAALASVTDSMLITGVPGAGKSGLVADLADALPGEKVVLAVDAVPSERAMAQLQWKLTADLAEVLQNWDGPEPATLILDGLDAHRGGASWLAELVQELQGTRWRVIATIRQFELKHSYRWRQLFPGSPVDLSAALPSLPRVRHVVIPNFAPEELAAAANGSPSLAALLEGGGEQLRELLSNPFTLSLAADLVGQVPVEQLAALRTQVQVLGTYWQVRVLEGPGHVARSVATQHLVERMTAARTLEIIPDGGVDADAVEQLVSRGVLQEVDDGRLVATAKPVRFRHHIVFDFALAASLRGQQASRLPHVLAEDPDFVVFGRPAIDFHLADLWFSENDRHSFWDTTLTLAETESPLAVAAATATAVRHVTSAADLSGLVDEAAGRPAAGAMVVNHVASALDAAGGEERSRAQASIAAFDVLVSELSGLWLDVADPSRIHAIVLLTWAMDRISPLPRNGAEGHAAAIVRMLKIAVDDPSAQQWLGEQVLRLVVGALSLDPAALPMLLRCFEQTVTSVWGLLPLRPVLEKLADVAQVDPTAAGQLAAAPYLFDASNDAMVPMGSSQILAMTESWSQAHGGLRYIVEHRWAGFEAVNPRAAAEALATILEPLADGDGPSTTLSWHGISGHIGTSRWLGVADQRDAEKLVDAAIAAMAARADADTDTTLRVWTARISHPDAWRKLLQRGTSEPRLGIQLRSLLLETSGLFTHLTTRAAAIRLAAAVSPLISDEEHTQLEQVITDLPASEPDQDLRPYLAAARDEALSTLDRNRIQTESAKARLDELATAETEASSSVPSGPVSPNRRTDDDQWQLWRIDPTTLPESVRSAVSNTGAALADGVSGPERWTALASAVVAERQLDADSNVRNPLRYRISALVNSVIGPGQLDPHEATGTWIANLLVAFADDSLLPAPPEELC